MLSDALLWLFLFSTLIYCLLILFYFFGWNKLRPEGISTIPNMPGISIIVAARNEEGQIQKLIESIGNQNYPSGKFELLIINDGSEDQTVEKAKSSFLNFHNHQFRIVDLPESSRNPSSPKKSALNYGIKNAQHDLIITTDADCWMGPDWIGSIINHFTANGSDMIIAPVLISGSGISGKFQELEMAGLLGLTAGSLSLNRPILCNGANLFFRKKKFFELDGYSGSEDLASGDDIFLLQKMLGKGRITFIKNKEAVVFTSSKDDLSELFFQRKRWASKWNKTNIGFSKFNGVTVFIFNFLLIAVLLLSMINSHLAIFVFSAWGIKVIIDFLFLYLILTFFKKKDLLLYFLPLQILYPFYTLLMGLISNTGGYRWKNRDLN